MNQRSKLDLWSVVANVGLALSLLILTRQLATVALWRPGDLLRQAAGQIWVVTWMMALTWKTRTLGLRAVVSYWLVGYFTVMVLVFVLVGPAAWFFGESSRFVAGYWAPLMEELAKTAPLAGFLALCRRRPHMQPAISDLILLGVVVGSGLAFHEDALWFRVAADGFGSSLWGVLFPVFLWKGSFVVTHVGWGAVLGLAVGIYAFFRHVRWAATVAATIAALVVLDHTRINYRGGGLTGRLLDLLLFDGRLLAWLLLLGVGAALAFELWIQRCMAREDRVFPHAPLRALRAVGRGDTLWRRVRAGLAYLRYHRGRTAVHYAIWRWRPDRFSLDPRSVAATLLALAAHAGLLPVRSSVHSGPSTRSA